MPTSPQARAKAQIRRQSDAGRRARQAYLRQPEVKMRMAIKRQIKSRLHGGT